MADLLVPFSRSVGWLPAGLPTSDGGVLPHTVNPRNPWWSAGSVDLSAPPLDEHGEPTRLDALTWAIGVLGRRLGILRAEASLFRFRNIEALTIQSAGCRRILVGPSCSPGYVEGAGGFDGGVLLLLPDWPALAGLDDDEAARAIVAAALRARVGLGEVGP